jgi:FMN phosphatase YigB (HAD superfamily)
MANVESGITHIFWDWHGVLGMKGFWYLSSKSNPEIKKFTDYAFATQERIESWMRNKLTFEAMRRASGTSLSSAELIAALINDWADTSAVINKPLFYRTRRLYPKARHSIITDNMDVFDQLMTNNAFVRNNFVRVFNSSTIGKIKKDSPGLFEEVLRLLGLPSYRSTLLIDDSQTNCARFVSLEGQAILMPGGSHESSRHLQQ